MLPFATILHCQLATLSFISDRPLPVLPLLAHFRMHRFRWQADHPALEAGDGTETAQLMSLSWMDSCEQ